MSSPTTTADQNVAIMHHFVRECQEKGDFALIDELLHPDFIDHTPPPGGSGDREESRNVIKELHAIFADIKMEVTSCIGQGDLVATNKVLRGRQVGEWMGTPGNGELVEMRIMDFVVVVDGEFREHWATIGPLQPVQQA